MCIVVKPFGQGKLKLEKRNHKLFIFQVIKWSDLEPLKRLVWFMMFNATFNNISVISRRLVLLMDEARVPGENHRPVASH